MSVLPEVLRVLDESLGLAGRSAGYSADTPLLGAGLDSTGLVALMAGLEQHFGVVLPYDELDRSVFDTVGSLSDFMDALLQRAS